MKTSLKIAVVLMVLAGLAWLSRREFAASDDRPEGLAAEPEPGNDATGAASRATSEIPTEPARVALTSEPSDAAANPAPVSGPIQSRLRALDEATGETVPFLALRLHDADGTYEDCVCDSQGLASFTRRQGPLSLEIRDEGARDDLVQSTPVPERLKSGRIALEVGGEEPIEVRVPVGPTWRLQLRGAPSGDPTSFRALFSSADPRKAWDKAFARPHAGDGPLSTSSESSPRFAGPWLRFGPLARLVSGGPPWRIQIVSDDGFWSGQAEVDANTGEQPLPLSIVVEPRGRLSGRAVDAAAKPVVGNWMVLSPPDASFDDPARRPLLCLTDGEGNYRFDGVAPGAYSLSSELKGHEPFRAEIQIVALQAATREVAFTELAGIAAGRVVGRVRSNSGAYEGYLKAALSLKNPPSLESTKVVWEETSSGKIGRFVFEGVGEDGPKVTLFGNDLFAIDPPEANAAPFGTGELEFTVLDGGPCVELSFAVQAEGSQDRVQAFEVFLETHLETSPRRTTARTKTGSASVRGFTPGMRYTWRLRADGFVTTWGVDDAAATDATVILVPQTGFGLEVVVNDSAGNPLEGATVRFDALDVGTTDAFGVLHAYAEAAPKAIHVIWKDWIPLAKSAVAADGTWRAFQDRVTVVLGSPK